MLDLLIRNATLPDGRKGTDIGVANGRIVEVRPQIAAQARERSTPTGLLVTPPFVDRALPHGRDAVLRPAAASTSRGTLLEGIALWGELKPDCSRPRRSIERALQYCDWAVARGLLRHPQPCRRLR